MKAGVNPIRPMQVVTLRAKLADLRRRLPIAHVLGISILEASGAWGDLRREDLASARPSFEAVDIRAARVYCATESVASQGKLAEEHRLLLLSTAAEPQNPEANRLAALHALGNLSEVPVNEIASIAPALGAGDINLHVAVLKILAEKGGAPGKAALKYLLERYLGRVFNENERNAGANPQVLAAYLDRAEEVVLVAASWYVIEKPAYGGSPPQHAFTLWPAGDRRNVFAPAVLSAYARAAKRLGRQNPPYALDLLDRLRRIPIVRQDSEIFGAVLEAVGELGTEPAWTMLMQELPGFPFDLNCPRRQRIGARITAELIAKGRLPDTIEVRTGEADAFIKRFEALFLGECTPEELAVMVAGPNIGERRRYIRRLLGEPDKPDSPPPSAMPANRITAMALSSLATAVGNFTRKESLEILEAIGAWAFHYSKPLRLQMSGPAVKMTHDMRQTYKGASYVEEKVVRALTNIIITEHSKPRRDNQLIERAWHILAEMVALTVEVYHSGEATPGGARRLANKYVLAAYTDAIKVLREIGKFGEGVDFLALQSMSSTYNLEEVYRAAYRAMAVINVKEFLNFAEVRQQSKITDEEKIGIAYAIGEAFRSRAELGTLAAKWNEPLVRDGREILERLLDDSGNSSLVHQEALRSLACFADLELETTLVRFLRSPQLPKSFDRPFTEEILRLLAGFGGETTLALLTDLLEGKIDLRGVERLDINKLALDALALMGRRLQGKPMELRPYAAKG